MRLTPEEFNTIEKMAFLSMGLILIYLFSYSLYAITTVDARISGDLTNILHTMEEQKIDISEFPDELDYLKARTDFNTLALFWLMVNSGFLFIIIFCGYWGVRFLKTFWFKHKKMKTLEERVQQLENWRTHAKLVSFGDLKDLREDLCRKKK